VTGGIGAEKVVVCSGFLESRSRPVKVKGRAKSRVCLWQVFQRLDRFCKILTKFKVVEKTKVDLHVQRRLILVEKAINMCD
jgi:hypothetical protein